MDERKEAKGSVVLWEWVKALSTITLIGIVAYRALNTPIDLTIDFPTLLSLLLALFSVGLAALFYFKATETSNTFYDNTYKFTKDIAQLLAKIESGFGERLRHLDEGYSSMRDYLQQVPSRSEKVESTRERIDQEKQEIEKVLAERDEIIGELLERSQLHAEERKKVAARLREKEAELSEAQAELTRMNRRLAFERVRQSRGVALHQSGLANFTRHGVVEKIGAARIRRAPSSYVKRIFSSLADNLPTGYLKDLEDEGFYEDGGLTTEGVRFLRFLARTSEE